MRWELAPGVFCLVPSARLELAQLSPLPPQDSVSTNFTTTADCCLLSLAAFFCDLCSVREARQEFYLEKIALRQSKVLIFGRLLGGIACLLARLRLGFSLIGISRFALVLRRCM